MRERGRRGTTRTMLSAKDLTQMTLHGEKRYTNLVSKLGPNLGL